VLRLLREYKASGRPVPWFIGENVAGHISMGIDVVLSDLEAGGYACQVFVIPAVAVDAKHRRDRVWILASNSEYHRSTKQKCKHRRPKESYGGIKDRLESGEIMADAKSEDNRQHSAGKGERQEQEPGDSNRSIDMADANRIGLEGTGVQGKGTGTSPGEQTGSGSTGGDNLEWSEWPVEPDVGRVANGVPSRMDRIKCLGNAIVPQIAEKIGRSIIAIERLKQT
jgi:DNA (cytosine-5)-methyltransferase 1